MGWFGGFFDNPKGKKLERIIKAREQKKGTEEATIKTSLENEKTITFTVCSTKKDDLPSLVSSKVQDLIKENKNNGYKRYSNIAKEETFFIESNKWCANCEIIFYLS